MVRTLPIERQIETILPRSMSMVPIEIDAFAGEGDRKAFLVYHTEVMADAARLRSYTNGTLYIEATLPRITEPNYEQWLMRIFHPGINTHVTVGIALIPRELLYSIKHEANCLEKVFKAIC